MTDPARPLRLGFPVKVMGRPDLKTQDTRRWQKNPHLRCSLELLDKVLDYLRASDLDMYRLSSDIAPYATHPDLPQFHSQVKDSATTCARSALRRGRMASDCRSTRHNMSCLTPPIPN